MGFFRGRLREWNREVQWSFYGLKNDLFLRGIVGDYYTYSICVIDMFYVYDIFTCKQSWCHSEDVLSTNLSVVSSNYCFILGVVSVWCVQPSLVF